jgi:RNA polymerase sigma factor (sigma-70 family)
MTLRSRVSGSSVRDAQAGNAVAQESVLRSLAAALLPFAATLAANHREADILVGDTLSRVYERLAQLEDPEAVVAWARQTMLRLFIDQKRRYLRRREFSIESVIVAAPQVDNAAALDLRHAVDRLGPPERALLVLHYWVGMNLEECAQELGVPLGTVKSRLHKLLKRLRAEVGGQ